MAIQDVFQTLDNLGFTDVFLPFILVYTIMFAILQKISIFGTGSKKYNAIISLASALAVIIPHSLGKYPAGTDIVEILNTAIPNVSLLIVTILFIMVVSSFFGVEWGAKNNIFSSIVTIGAMILVVLIFGTSAGWFQATGALSFLQDPDIVATLLIVGVFWLIISTMLDERKPEDKTPFFVFTGGEPAKAPDKKQGGG